MSTVEVRVPDLGGAEEVDVVEVLVAVGDEVGEDDGLITLESEKASMDVPAPAAGTVRELHVEAGGKVREGDRIATLETAGEERAESPPEPESATAAAETTDERAVAQEADDDEGEEESEEEGEEESEKEREGRPAAGDAYDTQLLVLGGGPGGYTAAFRAADLGLEVTLVERYPVLGGVCLNVGCIPSKALLHAARVIEEAKDLSAHGLDFGEPKADLDKLRVYKQGVVERLNKGLDQLARKRKVNVITGHAELTGPHEVAIDTDDGRRTLTFEQAILAAGSRSLRLPDLPDDERIMTSTGALELPEVPKRLLVVGGGIIGLEMACVYASLGAEITVVELTPGLMPGCDRDLVRPLERRLKKRFDADILLATKVTRVGAQKNGLKVSFEGEQAPEKDRLFDRILLSVGRRPNGDQIGVEAAGVTVGDRGFLEVDSQQRTDVPHIFAIGDLVPGPMLAHKATHEGKVAAEAAAGEKSHFDARVIPSVAFTDPEIAWVGLTESEAKENGTAHEVGRFPWAASGRALGLGRDEGTTKLLFDPETQRVLGGGIVGPNAGDLISEIALAIEMGCEAEDIGLTVHPHPTLSETVAFAAEAVAGTLTDL